VLTQTTGDHSITVNYRNARPDGGVDANVAADAEPFFEWLALLEARYGVTLVVADIGRSADGTGVEAQITLVRQAAQ
jgi:type II secretory pathway component PulM